MQTPEISREVYKTIKHYSRAELERFCTNLYMRGYNDGRESVPGIDIEQVCKAIARVDGIGQKRMAAIRTAIDKAYEEC